MFILLHQCISNTNQNFEYQLSRYKRETELAIPCYVNIRLVHCFYLHWSNFLEEVHFQADYFFQLVRYEYKYTVSSVHFDFVLNQVIFQHSVFKRNRGTSFVYLTKRFERCVFLNKTRRLSLKVWLTVGNALIKT